MNKRNQVVNRQKKSITAAQFNSTQQVKSADLGLSHLKQYCQIKKTKLIISIKKSIEVYASLA